jgi:hypothetical protein
MDAGGDESGDVCHIDKQVSADLTGEFAHAFKIDDARVSRCPDGDQRRVERARGFFELIIVDALVLR